MSGGEQLRWESNGELRPFLDQEAWWGYQWCKHAYTNHKHTLTLHGSCIHRVSFNQQHTETSLLTADRIFRAFRPTQTHTELSENRNCFNQGFGASSALLLEQITSWTTYMRSTLAHSDAHTDTLKHTFTSAHMHTS